ncbi:hypothetical protein [Alcanivorax sp. DSM 26293]|uniref:hypothetical protein n=1 Tax=Alcanivorax sp. DSM 26293 TaxID=1798238 RepID=UPI000CDED033|nr:hypothetical protein [Alcanivorax sp. DSM 26293]
MNNKANVLVAAVAGIGVWVGAIYMFTSDSDPVEQQPATQQPAESRIESANKTTTPNWSHITTISQAEKECPRQNNNCIRHGAVSEWGQQCKAWLELEGTTNFTPQGDEDLYKLFSGRINKNTDGEYILRGIEMKGHHPDGLEFRYEYGCRIDPQQNAITGIAEPVPVYTGKGLRFKDFN